VVDEVVEVDDVEGVVSRLDTMPLGDMKRVLAAG